ncbi:MAG: UbiA-like polyprenyltransferase [Aureispira sp.]
MKHYLSLIKFSHTIFALPFACIGFFLATTQSTTNSVVNWTLFLKVLAVMVFARSAAMAFNRYIDRDIDAKNPRTAVREIPAGIVTPTNALLFIIGNCMLFIITCYFINPLCFYLSPVAIAVILGYSYTKRFTALCHFVLGVGLALAPVGAYLAVTGAFDTTSQLAILYGCIVLFWVAGFDIIYALQDEEFDRDLGLNSIPATLGKKGALWLSNLLHTLAAVIVLYIGYTDHTHTLYWIGAVLFIGLLFYQHLLVKPNDLSKVNLAFFTTNGVASVVFGILVITDMYWIV